ncbi:hypothetical protein DMP05_08830 [Slackia isoflavoniconvertens]|uniref:RelA/SpoT domain-containing protein n=2 Tax=Slackia isoflavoniconvertens TaxID=572010 RepID=A0A3N0I859_9ACTN|nr:hypothetical protein DMP05_08830 [Slackia isoflavoniconvertens]
MLSFQSNLGISLKKNLHYFDQSQLLEELDEVRRWYLMQPQLSDLPIDYRIKSQQSIELKFSRYYPDHQVRKVFNDILGFRSLVDSYKPLLDFSLSDSIRIADMSLGKAHDDGYRGVHVYYQRSGFCYPIEIQYNTFYDRQFNNWLHKYTYKRVLDVRVGARLRLLYERGKIRNEEQFVRSIRDVLSGC